MPSEKNLTVLAGALRNTKIQKLVVDIEELPEEEAARLRTERPQLVIT